MWYKHNKIAHQSHRKITYLETINQQNAIYNISYHMHFTQYQEKLQLKTQNKLDQI